MASPPPSSVAPTSQQEPPQKRKRGRPRKYSRPEDGPVPLGVVIATPAQLRPIAPKPEQFSSGEKRGRGRPPGSGKKSNPLFTLPSAKVAIQSAGTGAGGAAAARAAAAGQTFTPRVITVPVGEDVAGKILGFSQQGPRAVCVMSANGSISSVTLRHDSSFGGNTTYEGKYEILSLSGSFLFSDVGGTRSRSGGLSVSLAAADGKVVGGSVSGLLVAATPVQIVVGSFTPTG
ncbi:unnamed protein product [Calypogeia fissa]